MSGKENIIMIIITQAKERENLDEILSVLIPVFFFFLFCHWIKTDEAQRKTAVVVFFIIIQSEMLRIPTGSRYILFYLFCFLKEKKNKTTRTGMKSFPVVRFSTFFFLLLNAGKLPVNSLPFSVAYASIFLFDEIIIIICVTEI